MSPVCSRTRPRPINASSVVLPGALASMEMRPAKSFSAVACLEAPSSSSAFESSLCAPCVVCESRGEAGIGMVLMMLATRGCFVGQQASLMSDMLA